ncbi:adhesin operon regulatory protein [Vibrio phage 1.083.O._10N.286.52.B9]|nr:adhesin operon regulatory protein [Vibrio phage 1.083.O._10N.286.52.B9]
MKHLIQGQESKESLDLLMSLTSIRSDKMINALHRHYVDGLAIDHLVNGLNVDEANFRRVDKIINNTAETINNYNELQRSVK